MKRRVLWKLSVLTSDEAEEAVAELLVARFGQPASTYTDLKTGQTTVTAYLATKAAWSRAAQDQLAAALAQIETFGSNGRGKIKLTKVQPENWREAWKRHFKPLEIRSRLLVKPSWSRRRPKRGQVTVVLDPGMSFGTGQHPTTNFCLKALVAHRCPEQQQSLLDIGTGSGILAISAAKLGYEPVEAFDVDPEALAIAKANARLNAVSHLIRFEHRDVTRLALRAPRQYSVVCANLISTLLQAEIQRVVARLEPGGLLVLAGVLKTEFPQIQAIYEGAGLRLMSRRVEREWCSGGFLRRI
jgi:ribosomal protein L11 methyltransferase